MFYNYWCDQVLDTFGHGAKYSNVKVDQNKRLKTVGSMIWPDQCGAYSSGDI